MEVDEIAGDLQADDVRAAPALEHADREAFDQDRAARAFGPPAGNLRAALERVLALDHLLDELLFIFRQCAAQSPHQEAPGSRIASQLALHGVGQGVDPLRRARCPVGCSHG